ncbi:MAG TPA: tetratricopeptide repeat protein [Terriglobales bacterium]|jgi:tetratricopeptide (TPR) repeat protein|nr:tetratricopeptide repeat protein [Terriglobales bacterium]
MKNILLLVVVLSSLAFAQQPASNPESVPAKAAAPEANPKPGPDAGPKKVDKAAAYYHFTMAHMYEEEMAAYGRSDLVSKAIDEYRQAISADPTSEYLSSGLAELYSRTGRIRDAVSEAQDILKRDPQNLEAHRLLGHIYLRSLGDMQGGSGSDNVLKLAIEQYEEIVKLDPRSMDDHMMLGRLYQADNQLQKAEAEEKTAVKLAPDSEDAVLALAMLYNEQGDSTKAAQTLAAVPENNRSAKLYSLMGATYDQQKDYTKAIDAYQHAIALDRDNLDAIRGLADSLLNSGQTDKALQQYKVIADANPEDARTYIRMAEIYRKQGKLDVAIQNLKKASSLVKDDERISYELAEIYQAQGRYDDATQQLQTLLKSSEKADNKYTQEEQDNRAIFLERLGSVYRDNNNEQAALDTFQKMLALGDDNAKRGYQEIIDTYRQAKQWQKATDAAKEATQKMPKDHDLQMVYAGQLADSGQPDAALQQVKSLLNGSPDDREVYINLATMYSRLKRWPEAEAALDKAAQLSTKQEDKDAVEFLRASGYERQKKYAEAETLFRKILSSSPDNAAVLNYLGYMMADHGEKLDEAFGMIKKAVDLEPANGAYLDSLGWAYYKLGKYDLAEDNLIKAAQHLMGADPTVQEHLGDLYQKTGRLKLAAAHWERAVDEWNKTVQPEVDQDALAKVQKKLESAKVRLAQQENK